MHTDTIKDTKYYDCFPSRYTHCSLKAHLCSPYGYGHGWSLLSTLCIHFFLISVCLLEAYVAVPLEIVGAVSGSVQLKQDKRNAMKENILEIWWIFLRKDCEVVRNYRHICDVTLPGTGTDDSNKIAGKKEIGQEMNVSWAAAKEKWRFVRHRFVRWEAPSTGCTA